MDLLNRLFSRFTTSGEQNNETEEKPEQLLPEVSIQGVVDYIKSEKCKWNRLKSIYFLFCIKINDA